MFRLAARALLKGLHGAREFEVVCAREVVVALRRRRAGVAMDGEVKHLDAPLRFCRPSRRAQRHRRACRGGVRSSSGSIALLDPLAYARPMARSSAAHLQWTVARVLSEADSVQNAVHALLPALATALQWPYAALWLVDAGADELRCVGSWSAELRGVREFAEDSEARTFKRGEGLPGRSWAEGKPVAIASVHRELNLPRRTAVVAAGLSTAFAFPVVNAEGVAGVLECFAQEGQTLSADLVQVAEGVGRQVGHFLLRKAAEDKLEENQARYGAIVNGALDAIVAIDEYGRVLEFNPAAEQMFGYSRVEAIGRDLAELTIPERFRDDHRAGLQRQRQALPSSLLETRVELTAQRCDHTEFPVELTVSRARLPSGWAFVGFMRDLTERRQHEEERDALRRRERVALDQALTASAAKDAFLAALSHELRTPLNAVLGWSHMIESGLIAPERCAATVSKIRRNAEAQLRLIEEMLDLSAFIAGRVRLSLGAMPVAEAVHAAFDAVKPAAEAKRLRWHMDLPAAMVHGDRARLQQVFWNIFANAVKFTPAGGLVTTTAHVGPDEITVSITDSGQGIPTDFLPFVFDRFSQTQPSVHHGSLGLGLAIARQIVEAHGGRISASSAGVGGGATFSVSLPRTHPD